jgi:hypothetical protein
MRPRWDFFVNDKLKFYHSDAMVPEVRSEVVSGHVGAGRMGRKIV